MPDRIIFRAESVLFLLAKGIRGNLGPGIKQRCRPVGSMQFPGYGGLDGVMWPASTAKDNWMFQRFLGNVVSSFYPSIGILSDAAEAWSDRAEGDVRPGSFLRSVGTKLCSC